MGEQTNIKVLARELHPDHKFVKKWLKRFIEQGFAGMDDKQRPGSLRKHPKKQPPQVEYIPTPNRLARTDLHLTVRSADTKE